MKTYLQRQIIVNDKQIVRNVKEKNGVTTIRYQKQTREVTLASGSPQDRNSTWKAK